MGVQASPMNSMVVSIPFASGSRSYDLITGSTTSDPEEDAMVWHDHIRRTRLRSGRNKLAIRAGAGSRYGIEPLEDRTLLSSLWSDSVTPGTPSVGDSAAAEVGIRFESDVAGYVTGLRFYKGPTNTGTHIGHLWSSDGTLLAAAIFTNETATGWQQVTLTVPVAIQPNTIYVASYHTDVGHYAADRYYFSGQGFDNSPLHALADGSSGHNGVFVYGAWGFPTNGWESSNYWVDVVFTTASTPDTLPPVAVDESPAPGAAALPVNTTLTVDLSEPIQPKTLSFVLRNAQGAVVPATVTYNAAILTATLTPTATLPATSGFTATVSGVKDLAGNRIAAPLTWSFTTNARFATDYDSIPILGAQPTLVSTLSGPWSDPNTWSAGRVPAAGDVVSIAPKTTVTYDVASAAVLQSITILAGGTLRFLTNINTEVIAANYLVLPGGTLQIGTQAAPVAAGVTAKVLIADQPLNTTLDPRAVRRQPHRPGQRDDLRGAEAVRVHRAGRRGARRRQDPEPFAAGHRLAGRRPDLPARHPPAQLGRDLQLRLPGRGADHYRHLLGQEDLDALRGPRVRPPRRPRRQRYPRLPAPGRR
jgi:hypothetical protein